MSPEPVPPLWARRHQIPRPRVAAGGRIPLLLALLLVALLSSFTVSIPSASAARSAPVGFRLTGARAAALPRLLIPALAPVANMPPGAFPFKALQSADGLLTIHYYNRPENLARGYIALAQQDLQHPVVDTLGFTLVRPVDIYIYNSRTDFLAGAPVSNSAETDALADPIHHAIYLTSADQSDEGAVNALPHELTHIVFHQGQDVGHLQGHFRYYPLWLDEGLAAYDEPPNSPYTTPYDKTLAQAVSNRKLVDILRQFVTGYPTDPDQDFLAYAESRSFISYLIATYGPTTFHHFLVEARGTSLVLAAQEQFGASVRVLESRWEASLGLPPTVSNQGFAPAVPAPQVARLVPLSPLASQTRPFFVREPLDATLPWLVLLLAALALAIEQLLQEWLRARRSRAIRRGSTPGGLLYLRSRQPSTSGDETTDTSLGSAPVPSSATILTLSRAEMAARSGPRWYDAPLVLVPLPLALGAAYAILRDSDLQAWYTSYVVAALVATPFILLYLLVLWRARRFRHVPTYRIIGAGIAIMTSVIGIAQATPIARTQAHAYEQRGAYALALHDYATAGGRANDTAVNLERVHIEWAQAAVAAGDYATAEAQVRALFTLDPSTLSSGDPYDTFTTAVIDLGQRLIRAHRYDEAIRLYADAEAFQGCPADCRTSFGRRAADTNLLWASALENQGDFAGALDRLNSILQDYSSTPSAATAQAALPEVKAQQLFSAALAAGSHGDYAAMNAQLSALIATYPQSAAAAQAHDVAQPVTGVVRDSVTNASVAGDHLFFIAFSSESDARAFDYDFSSKAIVSITASTIGAGGAFTARLQPGYWYVPFWDDPSQPANAYFNAPLAGSGNDAFSVSPLTPIDVGSIAGY